MQINRLFEIVYILLSKKSITARELSERFEVSPRTIYRDVETLCQAGIPIYTNKGKGGGICLLDNFILNKSLLSEKEQTEILSALQGMNATSYPDVNQVLSKLNSIFGSKNSNWIEVDFSYWNSNEEDKTKFYQLKDAIINKNVLIFKYFNSYGKETLRTVEPIKLLFKGQAWYLYAFSREKEDFRFFKISRMKEVKKTNEIFDRNPPDKMQDYSGSYRNDTRINLKFKVDSEMAYRIFDEFPSENVTENSDGSFTVITELFPGGWLYGYLMSYEDHIELLEPENVREELINKYKNAIKKYKI